MERTAKKVKLVFEFIVMFVIAILVGISAKSGVAMVAEIIFKGGK